MASVTHGFPSGDINHRVRREQQQERRGCIIFPGFAATLLSFPSLTSAVALRFTVHVLWQGPAQQGNIIPSYSSQLLHTVAQVDVQEDSGEYTGHWAWRIPFLFPGALQWLCFCSCSKHRNCSVCSPPSFLPPPVRAPSIELGTWVVTGQVPRALTAHPFPPFAPRSSGALPPRAAGSYGTARSSQALSTISSAVGRAALQAASPQAQVAMGYGGLGHSRKGKPEHRKENNKEVRGEKAFPDMNTACNTRVLYTEDSSVHRFVYTFSYYSGFSWPSPSVPSVVPVPSRYCCLCSTTSLSGMCSRYMVQSIDCPGRVSRVRLKLKRRQLGK